MKSQDIVVFLKLISLHRALAAGQVAVAPPSPDAWSAEAETAVETASAPISEQFTTRGLESALGLSKSEVSQALRRGAEVGLVLKASDSGHARADATALFDFIAHGLKYVFPARPGPLVRGIPTAAAAPVLQNRLAAPEDLVHVWPDPLGKVLGQRIEPLYKSVPQAVKRDADLYAMLALVDAVRIGKPREAALAGRLLQTLMGA